MLLSIDNRTYSDDQLPDLIKMKLASDLPEWEKALFDFLANWYNHDETIQAQTSGSTGIPKQILLKKESMLASARLTNLFFELREGDTALLCLSANYIAGKMMIVRAIAGNLNLNVVEPTSAPNIEQNFGFSAMVPMQIDTLLKSEDGIKSLQKISKLIIGGSAVSASLDTQLQKLTTNCFATYGMTETVSHVAIKILNGPRKSNFYQALPTVTFGQDDRECLIINAPHIQQEPLVTNDIVMLVNETQFEWLGRYDNVINSGGVKIFPEMIEKKLSNIISERFFVSSTNDKTLGEKVVLVIEGQPYSSAQLEALKISISHLLSRFEKPREIIFTPLFTETSTGKIKRIVPENGE